VKLYVTPSTEEQNFLADHRASIALAATVSDIQAGTAEVPLETNTESGLPPASIQETYGISDGNDLNLYSNMDTLANANATQVKDGKNPEIAQRFAEPRRRDLEGLLSRGVFELRNRTDFVVEGDRIFKTRYVDTVKNAGTKEQYDKLRLFICAFKDAGKDEIMTRTPTVSRASTRLMLSIAASHPDKILKSRDLDQAYTQSETLFSRKVLCEVPEELGLDDSWVLVLVRPLYGLGEAGLHWLLTFFRYHKEDIGLSPTSLDQCLFYKRDKNQELQALVSVQVDDSLAVGDAA
jgi:hypothetical protein